MPIIESFQDFRYFGHVQFFTQIKNIDFHIKKTGSKKHIGSHFLCIYLVGKEWRMCEVCCDSRFAYYISLSLSFASLAFTITLVDYHMNNRLHGCIPYDNFSQSAKRTANILKTVYIINRKDQQQQQLHCLGCCVIILSKEKKGK